MRTFSHFFYGISQMCLLSPLSPLRLHLLLTTFYTISAAFFFFLSFSSLFFSIIFFAFFVIYHVFFLFYPIPHIYSFFLSVFIFILIFVLSSILLVAPTILLNNSSSHRAQRESKIRESSVEVLTLTNQKLQAELKEIEEAFQLVTSEVPH